MHGLHCSVRTNVFDRIFVDNLTGHITNCLNDQGKFKISMSVSECAHLISFFQTLEKNIKEIPLLIQVGLYNWLEEINIQLIDNIFVGHIKIPI